MLPSGGRRLFDPRAVLRWPVRQPDSLRLSTIKKKKKTITRTFVTEKAHETGIKKINKLKPMLQKQRE
jgi:hypothetical protein